MEKVGRPSKYTKELADKICDAVSNSTKGLRIICEENPEFPHKSTIKRWFIEYPEFKANYARAKEEQADNMADDIIEIADDKSGDITYDKEGNPIANTEFIQRSKLRVDARKWIASKLKPKKYGDKLDLGIEGELTHNIVKVNFKDAE